MDRLMSKTTSKTSQVIKRVHKDLEIPEGYYRHPPPVGRMLPNSHPVEPLMPPLLHRDRQKALCELSDAGILTEPTPEAALERLVEVMKYLMAKADRDEYEESDQQEGIVTGSGGSADRRK